MRVLDHVGVDQEKDGAQKSRRSMPCHVQGPGDKPQGGQADNKCRTNCAPPIRHGRIPSSNPIIRGNTGACGRHAEGIESIRGWAGLLCKRCRPRRARRTDGYSLRQTTGRTPRQQRSACARAMLPSSLDVRRSWILGFRHELDLNVFSTRWNDWPPPCTANEMTKSYVLLLMGGICFFQVFSGYITRNFRLSINFSDLLAPVRPQTSGS